MDDIGSHILITRDSRIFSDKIKIEFQARKFGFQYEGDERCFYKPLWRMPPLLYYGYRLLVSVYTMVWLSITAVHLSKMSAHPMAKYPWPVWMTNWSYLSITFYFLYAFIISIIMRKRSRYLNLDIGTATLPLFLKLDWLLSALLPSMALIVTLIYYIALYPQIKHIGTMHNIDDLQLHGISFLLVFLDFLISARPVRLLHFIYPSLMGCLYVLFTFIYWCFDHSRVLYPKVVDWNHPGPTLAITVVLVFVISPVLQLLWYTLYRLKLYVFNRVYDM